MTARKAVPRPQSHSVEADQLAKQAKAWAPGPTPSLSPLGCPLPSLAVNCPARQGTAVDSNELHTWQLALSYLPASCAGLFCRPCLPLPRGRGGNPSTFGPDRHINVTRPVVSADTTLKLLAGHRPPKRDGKAERGCALGRSAATPRPPSAADLAMHGGEALSWSRPRPATARPCSARNWPMPGARSRSRSRCTKAACPPSCSPRGCAPPRPAPVSPKPPARWPRPVRTPRARSRRCLARWRPNGAPSSSTMPTTPSATRAC